MSDDLDALANELAEFDVEKKPVSRSAVEERVIAGFEDIQRFVEKLGRPPRHGAEGDIFERLYAVRLEQLAKADTYRELLEGLDHQNLLSSLHLTETSDVGNLDLEGLASDLQDFEEASPDITELRHVRSAAEKKAAENIANREKCEDFETFKSLFEEIQKELNSGIRETRKFELKAEIEQGRFFIVGGQKAYVAEMGETTLTDQGRTDARLRVIFENGTESNMLMRSLQRALNADGDAGRRITEPNAGPLFSDQTIDGDEASGTIYVLRSKANHPLVTENRELVHKIGVTNMSVEKRIAGAQLQPTFLMANVEVVASYELYNINRTKLENLIHRIFEPARLEIEIMDRFGRAVVPREWFLVPLFVIQDAVERIKDGTISGLQYDPEEAKLVRVK